MELCSTVVNLLPKTCIAFLVLLFPFFIRKHRKYAVKRLHWANVCRRVREQRDAVVHQLLVRFAGEDQKDVSLLCSLDDVRGALSFNFLVLIRTLFVLSFS